MTRGPSCTRDLQFKLRGNLHLPGDIWNPKHTDRPLQADASSRTGLMTAVLGALVGALGWTDGKMIVALLVDWINSFPNEAREAIATGIVEGQGIVVKREGDKILVGMDQNFQPLTKAEGENRTPSGLIIPGR